MRRSLILIAALTALALAACSDAGSSTGASDGNRSEHTGGDPTDPIIAEGNGLGSCAFEFSVQSLTERQFGFDGTVTEIREPAAMDAPYEVVFDVGRWYRGADGATALVRTYDVSGTSLAGDLGLAVGDRVLASGDEDFLWGCGFSMAYSDQNAGLFEQAFGS